MADALWCSAFQSALPLFMSETRRLKIAQLAKNNELRNKFASNHSRLDFFYLSELTLPDRMP